MPPPDLILIPTAMEQDCLLAHPELREALATHQVEVAVCGFGPIAAAASTARLLSSRPVRRAILAGIAGSYAATLPVGSAWQIEQVACWGIGVGSGPEFRLSSELGWGQLPAGAKADFPSEILPLFTAQLSGDRQSTSLALTCTAASDGPVDCVLRRNHFPTATVEEMEGFGVALACLDHQLATGQPVSLGMVRGISNLAGDRSKAHWQINTALSAVAQLLLRILKQDSASPE